MLTFKSFDDWFKSAKNFFRSSRFENLGDKDARFSQNGKVVAYWDNMESEGTVYINI